MKNVILAEASLIPLLGMGLGLLFLLILSGVILLLIFYFFRPSRKTTPAAPPVAATTQIIPRRCPQCGAELKLDVSEGLCPACLLQRGIATEGGMPPGTPAFVPPSIPDLARLFPQLEIIEPIGHGGMGAVYKARQPALDRFVALKILAPRGGSDLDFAGRFSREARALAKLAHPNIVAVYDFGATNGLNYFIMEFVDGPNLRQVEQAGKLSSREALEIIPQICAALQFAHDEGIVHRDIKPENILLDKKGRVKIADFGLAKILGQEAKDFRLTGARDIMGTPHYMAPEQMEKPQEVDHRADIYSLGVVFYEMLTGELPLGKFQPPSQKVRVDVRLDEVVLRSLAREPELRYQNVSEVKTRVETISSTNPPAAALPVSAGEILARDYALNIRSCLRRGWALVRSDFWPLVGMSAFVLVVLSALPSFEVVSSSGNAAGHRSGTTSILGLLLSGPLMGGLYLYFLKKIRRETAGVEAAFTGFRQPFPHLVIAGFLASLLTVLGLVCLILPGVHLFVAWILTFPLIVDQRLDFWPAMQLSRKLVAKHWWKFLGFLIVLGLINVVGIAACGFGLFITFPVTFAALTYAYEDITGAVKSPAGATSPIPPPDRFWRRFAIVMACVILIPMAIAILGTLAAMVIPAFVRARQHSQQAAARHWTQEGWQLWQDQKWDQAAAKFRQAVQLTPNKADAWNGLGWATFNSGKTKEAEQAFQKAISLDTNQPGALNGLGQIYLSQGKYAPAETYLLKAAPQAPAACYGLARLYLLEGKFPEAEKWAQQIVDSGQADDAMQQMLNAAKGKYLDAGLRWMIEPHTTKAPPASAETWSPTLAPGEKLDLQKILDEAKTFMEQHKYEESLQRHLWHFNHAAEFGDSYQSVVRLTSGLSDWEELGRRYPRAKQALMEIRDNRTQQLAAGQGYSEMLHEVQAINHELLDDDATVTLIKTIHAKDPKLTGQNYFWMEDLLLQKGEYDLLLDCMGNPQAHFESARRGFEMQIQSQQRMEEIRKQHPVPAPRLPSGAFAPPDLGQMATNNFVGQIRKLVEILVATGHKTDAEKIRDQAVTVLDDPRLKSAVSDAEAQIQKVKAAAGPAANRTTSHFSTRLTQIIKSAPAPSNVPATMPGLNSVGRPDSRKAAPGPVRIDPATGQPVGSGGTSFFIDPATGLSVGPGGTGIVNPVTGLPSTNAGTGAPASNR